jgi:dipeptidyl aminopeptidase/acylaminoacyl peptidase
MALAVGMAAAPQPLRAQAVLVDDSALNARVEHAEGYTSRKLLAKVLNTGVAFHWIDGGDRFWYRKAIDATHASFVIVDAATGRQAPLFDDKAMAAALASAGAKDVSAPMIRDTVVADDARSLVFSLRRPGSTCLWPNSGTCYTPVDRYGCDLPVTACHSLPAAPGPELVLSPDRRQGAFVRDHNLWLRDLSSGAERQLTQDGVEHFAYGEIDLPTDEERIPRRRAGLPEPVEGVAWSPDGRHLLAMRHDLRQVPDRLFAVEYTPPEGGMPLPLFERKAVTRDRVYPPAALDVIDVQTGAVRRSDIDPQAFNDYAVIHFRDSISWTADHAWLLAMTRAGREARMVCVDLASGHARDVIVERSAVPVVLNPAGYDRPNMTVLPGGREAIWYSERDGWGHLYLYDTATGQVKRQLTRGPWVVADLLRVDEARRTLYFTAAGKESGNPYYRRLYRVSLDGGEPELLTPENADHDFENSSPDNPTGANVLAGASLSPNGRYMVDVYSTIDQPDRAILRTIDGRIIAPVVEADASALFASGWKPPERFVVKAADGKTDLYGALFKPQAFDPTKHYPVVEVTYPGPQDKFNPVSFRDDFIAGAAFNAQAFAEAGAVAVALDGRSTSFRSAAFRNAFMNTEDSRGAVDHVAAITNLAATRPYIDLNRVGVTGHSMGGYGSLRAGLLYPDFFKVVVSGEGPADMLDASVEVADERLFGIPDTPEGLAFYSRVSNESLVGRMKGKVMIIAAGADENVPFQNAMQLFAAFEKAGKVYDTLIIPDAPHAGGRQPYAVMRTIRYFAANLGGPQ